jgi:hypothetical protein
MIIQPPSTRSTLRPSFSLLRDLLSGPSKIAKASSVSRSVNLAWSANPSNDALTNPSWFANGIIVKNNSFAFFPLSLSSSGIPGFPRLQRLLVKMSLHNGDQFVFMAHNPTKSHHHSST